MKIRRYAESLDPSQCHVLYIATSERERLADILHEVRELPILTVSEIQGFSHEGGIIELLRDGERIRFKIDLGVAHRAGLELSSRLLNLAVTVTRKESR